MMETKGILPNINSDSYQHIHESSRGINITSQAEVELGDNSALLDDSAEASNDTADKDMESLPEMLDDAITSKNGFSHDEKCDTEIESNDSIDIPKEIVETPLVPKSDSSKNMQKSENIVHTVDEDKSAANVVQDDANAQNHRNNKKVNARDVLHESSDAAEETEATENDTQEEENEEITNVPNDDRDLEMEPKPTVSAINKATPEIVDVEDSDEENDNSDEDDLKDEDSDDETGN